MTTQELYDEFCTFRVEFNAIYVHEHPTKPLPDWDKLTTLFLFREVRGLRDSLDRVMGSDDNGNDIICIRDTR